MRPAGIYKSHDIWSTIFHGPLTSDFVLIIKIKIFVQDRIPRPIDISSEDVSL